MKAAKCTSCGATIEVDENKEAGICQFCKTPYITEKAIANYSNTTNNSANVINNYYGPSTSQSGNIRIPKKDRPKLNWGLAFIGLYFGIIPGVLYIFYIKKKQKEWDDKYTY